MKDTKIFRTIFIFSFFAAVFFLIFKTWNILIPFILGLVLSYLVYPLVNRFVALGLRRDRVVLVLYGVMLVLVGFLSFFLLPALIREARLTLQELPSYSAAFDAFVQNINNDIKVVLEKIMGKKAQLFVIPLKAEKLLEVGLARLPENLLGVAHFGLWIFIIPFVTFFALIDGPIWIDTLFNVTPSEYVESLLGLLAEINETLGAYIRGQLLDAICVGSLTIIGLSILGVNGAVLLGTLTGFFNVVPFMAPVVGGGLALLAAAYQGLDGGTLLGVVILFGAMRILDDFVFIPFIIGSKIQLHPVVILFAVLSGFQVGGFLGLVFSIPMAAVIKVGLSVILNKKRESNLYNQKHVLS